MLNSFKDSGGASNVDTGVIMAATNDVVSSNSSFWYESLETDGEGNKVIIQDPQTIYDRYFDIFLQNTYKITLPNYLKYRPELLCKEMYGTTDLWYIILKLNGMYSHIEFKNKYVKIIDPNVVEKVIITINAAYKKVLKENHLIHRKIEDLTIHPIY